MQYDIFLSYRRSDQAIARALVEQLEARGISVWWDQMIEGGEDWRDAIVAGLEGAASLVILFSEECNASKQLKKELAIADTLDKLVVPVLIEDTQPKGHYLYELASRNWIQLFPNASEKAEKLADKLASTLDSAGLRSTTSAAPAAPPTNGFVAADPDSQPHQPTPTEAAVAAPPPARKKTTKAKKKPKTKQYRDFLPFKWIDILPVGALTAGFSYLIRDDMDFSDVADWGTQVLLGLMICASVYGAIAFPIRYYMRNRRVTRTAIMYVASSAVLFGVFVAGITSYNEGFDWEFVTFFGLFWLFMAVVALVIYGIMHAQRAMRSFRKNVEVI